MHLRSFTYAWNSIWSLGFFKKSSILTFFINGVSSLLLTAMRTPPGDGSTLLKKLFGMKFLILLSFFTLLIVLTRVVVAEFFCAALPESISFKLNAVKLIIGVSSPTAEFYASWFFTESPEAMESTGFINSVISYLFPFTIILTRPRVLIC